MWKTYSVLSKIRKPRISVDEFLNYYQMEESEIQQYELQQFLDFFEVSKDDLNMKTKKEVLLMLQGFHMDREAEKAGEDLNFKATENIDGVKFKYMSDSGKVSGEIDFIGRRLEYGNEVHMFSESDKSVLLQVIKDLGLMQRMVMSAGTWGDEVCELELTGVNGVREQVKMQKGHAGMFLSIVGAIVEKRE